MILSNLTWFFKKPCSIFLAGSSLFSSLSQRLNCLYSENRFLSVWRSQHALPVPPQSFLPVWIDKARVKSFILLSVLLSCAENANKKREPSLLIDRSATAREGGTTIPTFWFQLTKSAGKYSFFGGGWSFFTSSPLMRYNNYFSLDSLQPILPFLWMF